MIKPLILIVEDDDATAEFLSDLLRSEGYDTQTLPTARMADPALALQPDLILLDLVFPDSHGEDLLQAVRRDHNLGGTPVVLLSAVPHLDTTAARLPVQGYLSKPFDLDLLLHMVDSLIEHHPLPEPGAGIRWPSAGLVPNL